MDVVGFGLFESLFSPPIIRTQLAWEELRRLDAAVTARYLPSLAEEASRLIVPWYVADGRQVPYDDAGAQPLRLQNVLLNLDSLEPERTAFIRKLAASLAGEETVQLLIATYRAGGEEIILDGNHRAVAALLAGANCRILALSVAGPVDPAYLPDLVHWTPK